MKRQINSRKYCDEVLFRVWPDDTVQCTEDGDPYAWMSDDYLLVYAYSESDAISLARSFVCADCKEK